MTPISEKPAHHDFHAPWGKEMARWYSDQHGEHPCNHKTIEYAALTPHDTLLDIGCGTGSALRTAVQYLTQGDAIGLDYSAAMIAIAKEKSASSQRLRFVEGNAVALPFEDNSRRVITAINSIHHWPDPQAGLAQVARVLEPSGRLIICEDIPDESQAARNSFTFDQVCALLQKSGFDVVDHAEMREKGDRFFVVKATPSTSNQSPEHIFNNPGMAQGYDRKNDALAPLREVLNFGMCSVFADLPAQARILCVGAGTGAELLTLGKTFPEWQFHAVEPAKAMVDVCGRRVREQGLEQRCQFHHGHLETLPETMGFHGATSLLVSHFINDKQERNAYWQNIAERLLPGGILVSADLAVDQSKPYFPQQMRLWNQMLRQAKTGWQPGQEGFPPNLAVLTPDDLGEELLTNGFAQSVPMLQTLMIHARFSTVA